MRRMALSPAGGIAGMRRLAPGREPRPHHAALGHDQVVLGLRAQDQRVGPHPAALAQERHAVGPEILLVGHEGEDQLALGRPAAPRDLLGQPELHGHAALAVAGAQPVDQPASDQRLEGIALPVGALAHAHRVDMGVEGDHTGPSPCPSSARRRCRRPWSWSRSRPCSPPSSGAWPHRRRSRPRCRADRGWAARSGRRGWRRVLSQMLP